VAGEGDQRRGECRCNDGLDVRATVTDDKFRGIDPWLR